jgi:hypothetical protein
VKRPATIVALILLVCVASVIFYKVSRLDYPLFPAAPGQSWQLLVEARVAARDGNIRLSMGLPYGGNEKNVLEERMFSGALNFSIVSAGPNRFGVWSGTSATGEEVVTYQATILVSPRKALRVAVPPHGGYPPEFSLPERSLAERLAGRWSPLATRGRIDALRKAMTGDWGSPSPAQQDLDAWAGIRRIYGDGASFLLLARAASISGTLVEGVRLVEGVTNSALQWVDVYDGINRISIEPGAGRLLGDRPKLLPLAVGGTDSLKVSAGELKEVRWSVSRHTMSHWLVHFERIRQSARFLDRWSLFRLPEEYQGTFRILLLVPIGALLISFLRNVVGFPTFGVFMPVLMALSFRNTGLLYGLGIFWGVLLAGYGVRRYLDRLRLLLVPRMSVLLTLVIAAFTVLALIGNKLGLRQFMAVGLLPFVILTMTIERFFVVVEESGVKEGFITAMGSAVVALITYQIISWEPLQLTFFMYPELLGVVGAGQIMLGRYTGYRVSEYIRFKVLKGMP